MSGKRKQNTIKTTTVSDGQGRTLWAGAVRPGRMHDQTAAKTEGIQDLLRQHPMVRATVDAGYQGLAKAFPDQVHAPPPKPSKNAPAEQIAVYQIARKQQSSRRICVEHAVAEPKQCAPCSAGSNAASTTPRPTWLSPGWSLTGPPALITPHPAGPARPAWLNPNRAPSRNKPHTSRHRCGWGSWSLATSCPRYVRSPSRWLST